MTDKPIVVDPSRARALFLQKQLLTRAQALSGKAGTFKAIDTLGYVQIDTINVIERSHHIVLFNRCPDYRHSFLDELLSQDRKIFEYWAHMASYVPMKDYRYYIRKMKQPPQEGSWLHAWLKSNSKLLKKVLKKIEKEGALSARDFADVRGRKRGTWWDWKPAKTALEVLFWRGELMIKERRNFQRIYDLTDRVLPSTVNTAMPKRDEENRFFIKRALGALGIASQQDIQNYIRMQENPGSLVDDMVASGEICTLYIKGIPKSYYVNTGDLGLLQGRRIRSANRVYFLSPFDNTIILRDRTKALFDFSYALECYKPKKQRAFGYFCLPVLWKNALVGRIDMKADRKTSALIVRNLHLEKANMDVDNFLVPFMTALKKFARFHGSTSFTCEHVSPPRYKRLVITQLKKLTPDVR